MESRKLTNNPSNLSLFAHPSRQAKEESVAGSELLQCAVDATPESSKPEDETKLQAIAILKKHPELLFSKGILEDHFRRTIEGSAYQLFLGTGDIWALRQIHEEIIPKIEDGEAQAQDQFKEQFPYCRWPFDSTMSEEALYDDRNKRLIQKVKGQLQIIVEEIKVDFCTNGQAGRVKTKKAVADLRQILAPKEGEVIRTGLHFPRAIMEKICQVYDAQFTRWSASQLCYFSREVIGAAEAALTAVDGQCCKNGLTNLDIEKGPDRRDGLFCLSPKGLPQELTPISNKLGHTMFVDSFDGISCFLSSEPGYFNWYNKKGFNLSRNEVEDLGWASRGVTGGWTTFAEEKQKYVEAIMMPPEKTSTHRRS